jgi:hypothetical protein
MPVAYATLDEFKRRIINGVTEDDNDTLTDLLLTCSRAVEDYLEVSEDFFKPQTVPTTKNLLGNNTGVIDLPAELSGDVIITAPQGINVPNFDIVEKQLITLDSSERPAPWITWREVYYAVTGIWGFTSVPQQIKEATLQLGVKFWREFDNNAVGMVGELRTDTAYPERDYPKSCRRLLDEYRRKIETFTKDLPYIA